MIKDRGWTKVLPLPGKYGPRAGPPGTGCRRPDRAEQVIRLDTPAGPGRGRPRRCHGWCRRRYHRRCRQRFRRRARRWSQRGGAVAPVASQIRPGGNRPPGVRHLFLCRRRGCFDLGGGPRVGGEGRAWDAPWMTRRPLGTGPSTARSTPSADTSPRLLPVERVEPDRLLEDDVADDVVERRDRRPLGPGAVGVGAS